MPIKTNGANHFLNVAISAAKKAGDIHRKYFERGMKVSSKGVHDIVTNADLEAESKIISEIKRKFPEHNFLSEETLQKETKSEYRWIIDLLDGTINFSKNIPFFSISIALQRNEKTLVGVVYNPITKEMFTANRGQGAYLNNKRLVTQSKESLKESLVVVMVHTTFGKSINDESFEIMRKLISKVRGVHVLVSHALELAYVASDRIDADICLHADVYGAMAGKLLIEEAGGAVIDFNGNRINDKPWEDHIPLVAIGNPKLKNQLLNVIKI
jgi:fructose-1,6-bisphosphatase/inositol monophosphatase family enzyme